MNTPILMTLANLCFADVYVDVNAVDCAAGTGTMADPVYSIGDAINMAMPGDTIRIAPGTYFENVVLNMDLELIGTSGASVTTVDAGGSGSVITIPAAVTATIDGLTLTGGSAISGGGVFVSGTLALRNSTISGNFASLSGGGIGTDVANSAVVDIERCTIRDNDAGTFGHAVNVSGALVTVFESTISNNGSWCNSCSYGGGFSAFGGLLSISSSTISSNEAGFGGGIYSFSGPFQISNSTLTLNEASRGPAISIESNPAGSSFMDHVTITRNYARVSGETGGVSGFGAPIPVTNSIIANNNSIGPFFVHSEDARPGALNLVSNNLIGTGISGNGENGNLVGTMSNPVDAMLGSFLDHGGPTRYHRLQLGSPAIDAANPTSFLPVDQGGNPRPRGAAPDMGASEFDIGVYSLCNGDGGDQMGCTDCPCANNAPAGTTGGCLNSAGGSSLLHASGSLSVSLPSMVDTDLRFSLSGVPPNKFCVLTSGDAVAPGNPANPCFGQDSGVAAASFDGLRCSVMNTHRHGGRAADSNGDVGVTNNPWGGEGGPPIGIAQTHGGFTAGQTRYFQAIHRDDIAAVCMRGLNTSQAVEILFTP